MNGSSSTEKARVLTVRWEMGADQLGRRLATESGSSFGEKEGEGGRDAASPAGVPVRSTAEETEVE